MKYRKIESVVTNTEQQEQLKTLKSILGLKSSSKAYKESVEIALKVLTSTFPNGFLERLSDRKYRKSTK